MSKEKRTMYPQPVHMLYTEGDEWREDYWSERAGERMKIYVLHHFLAIGEEQYVSESNGEMWTRYIGPGDTEISGSQDYPLVVATEHDGYYYFMGDRYQAANDRDMDRLAEDMTNRINGRPTSYALFNPETRDYTEFQRICDAKSARDADDAEPSLRIFPVYHDSIPDVKFMSWASDVD